MYPDNRIREFCDRFQPCHEGRDWALANCTDMADAWDKLEPAWLIWVATREGVLADRAPRPRVGPALGPCGPPPPGDPQKPPKPPEPPKPLPGTRRRASSDRWSLIHF